MTPIEIVLTSAAGVGGLVAVILALAVWTLAGRDRRIDDAEHRAHTAERRLQLRDERDRREAAHWATTPAAEHPTVNTARGPRPSRRDWRDVG